MLLIPLINHWTDWEISTLTSKISHKDAWSISTHTVSLKTIHGIKITVEFLWLTDKSDKRIFYFKPDCVMLDDPEKQRQYRDKLLRKITAMPTPEPIHFMGDDLHKAILESIQDRSQPTVCKTHLANFYKRR